MPFGWKKFVSDGIWAEFLKCSKLHSLLFQSWRKYVDEAIMSEISEVKRHSVSLERVFLYNKNSRQERKNDKSQKSV